MKTTLLHRLPMIPRLTATDGKAECLAHDYVNWDLLEVDEISDVNIQDKGGRREAPYPRKAKVKNDAAVDGSQDQPQHKHEHSVRTANDVDDPAG